MGRPWKKGYYKDVTAVVQADVLVAWTRVVAVRLRKGFEICFGRRLVRT